MSTLDLSVGAALLDLDDVGMIETVQYIDLLLDGLNVFGMLIKVLLQVELDSNLFVMVVDLPGQIHF